MIKKVIHEKRIIRRERHYRINRESIIKSAIKMFAKYGYTGTKMKMIADAAGFSVGMLYKYYKSKKDLFKSIMRYQLMQIELKGEECENVDDSPLKRLNCHIRVTFEHFNENRDFMFIYYNENPIIMDKEINKMIKKSRVKLSDLLSEAARAGDIVFDEDDNLEFVSAMIIGAIDHMIDEYVSSGKSVSVDEMLELFNRIIIGSLSGRNANL